MRFSLMIAFSLAGALVATGCSKSEPTATAPTIAVAPPAGEKDSGGTLDGSQVNPEENPALPPAPGGLKLEALKSIKLIVKNRDTLNDMLSSGANLWIHTGKTRAKISDIADKNAFCAFDVRFGSSAVVKNGESLTFSLIGWAQSTTHFITADSKIHLFCAKLETATAWSTVDIAAAFGANATIAPITKQ